MDALENMLQHNAPYKTLDYVLDADLTPLRIELNVRIRELMPFYQAMSVLPRLPEEERAKHYDQLVSKVDEKFSQDDLADFLDRVEAIVADDPTIDSHALKVERQKIEQTLQTGKPEFDPHLRSSVSQLMWAATLSYLSIHPAPQENWPKENRFGDIARSKLWKAVTNSRYVKNELIEHAFLIADDVTNKQTVMRWGAPGSWFYFSPEQNLVNIDLIRALTTGLEHNRSVIFHEIGHSKLSTKFTPKEVEIMDRLKELEHKNKKLKIDLTEEEFVEYHKISQELQMRLRVSNSAEDSTVNHYAVRKSIDPKTLSQDYSVALNFLHTTLTGTGEMALEIRNDDGATPDLDETALDPSAARNNKKKGDKKKKPDIEEILKDPSEEGAENAELKEAQQKYQNICHAVNMCFFQHNGLFEDTPEGWKSVGVRTDWITEDPDYPDATGQTPGEALKYIQALCREMEETQPHASDKRYGPKKLAKLIDEHMDRRNEIAEEIWERYAKQFAQPVIDKAEEQTKERLEENKQKQEQQQQDQQQDQQEGGEQGENQEGEGEGQGQGQEGQEGQGQGQGQGDSSGQQSGDSGGQSDPSDLGGQQGGNSDDGLTVEGHNSPMEDQTAERPEDRQEAASGKGEEQEQDGQEQGDGQEGAGEEQGQEQEGQGQKGEGEGEEQGEGQSQGENGTEQGVGEGQSQGQDGNQQGQEEGEGQGEGEDGQTIEELLEEREQRKEEARKQEEEAKKKAKEAASKQKGGKADSAGSSYGLDNLPVGDWSDYTNTVQEYQGPIYEVAQMLEDLKKDYYEEQLSEDDHQLLPQGGDLSRFDPKRQLRLRQIIGTQRQPERDDFNFFTADEDCPTPIIDDVVIMIDVSGSMSSGNTRQRPIDMAVQAGCIWMEAGKMVGTNVRVFAWGSKDGPVLVASPDMDEETIGKNIMGMVKAAGGGTDLAPGIKGVNAALADKDNYRHMDLNAMSGGTHMIVVSDGDIFDSPEAQAEFEKTLENNPKVTTDWMIVNKSKDNGMAKMVSQIDCKEEQRPTAQHATSSQEVQRGIIDQLFERISRTSKQAAVPLRQKINYFRRIVEEAESWVSKEDKRTFSQNHAIGKQ